MIGGNLFRGAGGGGIRVPVWTSRSTGGSRTVYGSCIADGKVLVIDTSTSSGTQVRWSSNGGASWANQYVGSNGMRAIAYSDGLWVMRSTEGEISSSENLTTWTSRTSPFSATFAWPGLAYGGGVWVSTGASQIATSTDGIVWTARSGSPSGANRAVGYGDGRWIVGGSNAVTSTNNGASWSTVTVGVGINGVAYGDGMWVAVGDSGALATSPDGATWTSRTTSTWLPSTTRLSSVAFGNGLWVLSGDSGLLAYTLDPVGEWTVVDLGVSNDLHTVAFGDGMWVVSGGSGTTFTGA